MATGDPVHIVAPTIVRVTYKHQLTDGRPMDNIMDISLDEFGTSRDAAVAEMISKVSAPWQDNVLDVMADNVTYTGGSYIDLDSLTGTTGTFGPVSGHPTVGSGVNAMTAPQVAFLVHKNTAARRGQRSGRTFIGGVVEPDIDENGVVSGAKIANVNAKMSAYKNAINTLSGVGFTTTALRVVHVHKPNKDDPASWTWSSSDITSFSCDNIAATQRRRLRG